MQYLSSVKNLLITCGLLFCAFTSQAQSTRADSPKPALLTGPYDDTASRGAAVQAELEAYWLSHPCPYAQQGQNPNCIDGHQEGIIPVVYGFPMREDIQREQRGEIKLGRCMISGCDPHYYCTRHQKYL